MNMQNLLANLFELKIPNSVMSFWFIGKNVMESGKAKKPTDFEKYQLIEEKADADGFVWQCCIKKQA